MNIKVVTSAEEKQQVFQIRSTVFVKEQGVPEEIEIDEYDDEAIHFIGYINDQPIAASRLRWVGDRGKLERICVLKEQRNQSYGTKLIKKMEDVIVEHGYKKATLNSQTHAQAFYNSLGYETISEEFIDAGILHVTMVKDIE